MLNGDWTQGRAQKLAERVASVEEAWQYALGRPPTAKEIEAAANFIEKRTASEPRPAPAQVELGMASLFKENTPQERLVARTAEEEGDEFTVEAVVKLDSIDVNASVRTIASRWNNGKDNVEAFGWSLGVTGEKSRFKPRNLIIQLVGEDENRNIAYEPIASNLRPELGVEYHIVAKVSCSEHTVTFQMKQVGNPDSPVLTSVVPHRIRSGLEQRRLGPGHRRRASPCAQPSLGWKDRSRASGARAPAGHRALA